MLEKSVAGPSTGSGSAARAMPTRRTEGAGFGWELVGAASAALGDLAKLTTLFLRGNQLTALPRTGTAAKSDITGSELQPIDCPVAPTGATQSGCTERERGPLDKATG